MPQKTLKDIECACCHTMFRPRKATQRACSLPCARTAAGAARRVARDERACASCGKVFFAKATTRRLFCSHPCSVGKTSRSRPKETRICAWCSSPFVASAAQRKRFCDTRCSAKWRMSLPHIKDIMRASIPKSAATRRGVPRPDAAVRMRLKNPMSDPEVRERARQKLVGRTFLSRGGNGKTTPEQEAVANALGLPMEFPIPTADAKNHFPSLPTSYKVDVGCPTTKVAIEVDGASHRTKKWQFLDARKTSVLEHLGWCVLRFSNEEVRTNLPGVVATAQSCMTLRSKTCTTTSRAGS